MSGNVTMSEAAKLAGVTPQTIRRWVKDIPGAERLPSGEYRIPRHELMVYLAQNKKAKPSGSVVVGATAQPPAFIEMEEQAQTGDAIELMRQLLHNAQYQLQDKTQAFERLQREYAEYREKSEQEKKELKAEVKDALAEVRKLEAEMRAHLSGSGLIGAVSRWIKSK